MAGRGRMMVVAVDFGTTYSGYAYSFLDEFNVKSLDVHTLTVKTGSNQQMAKVPTSILFTPEKQLHSFGVEAEETYARKVEGDPKEAQQWFYFEQFKMTLHKNPSLKRDLELLDETKRKSLPALTVFSASIVFLKDHFMRSLKDHGIQVKGSDITWVLTVPAIWNDEARQFMREAAHMAGIPSNQLSLALEPEAAAVYCQEMCKERPGLLPFPLQRGKKFMVVDCGGGTIDISVSEITASGCLKQLHKPTGTADGGIGVDKAFKEFLCDLIGFDGVSSFTADEKFQLKVALEQTKRSFHYNQEKAYIEIPKSTCPMFSGIIASSAKYNDKVKLVKNKLALDGELFLSFFEKSTAGILEAMEEVLTKVEQVDAIFLAGGFGESDVIQNAVSKAFAKEHVVIDKNVCKSQGGQLEFLPVAAIMMGAVMYGHNPSVIATRVSPYTYGVAADMVFNDTVHDKRRLVFKADGKVWCHNCFHVHIRAGQELEVDTLLPEQRYHPSRDEDTEMPFRVFRTKKEDPLYIDEEGCEEIGTMAVLMPDTTGGICRIVAAAMMVGGTELKLVARDAATKQEFTTKCDFLPSV